MKKTVSLLALALTFAFTAAALAGGEQCAKDHAARKAKLAAHGWLGIETGYAHGLPTVAEIHPGSPAEKAGFRKGDVLVALNGVALKGGDQAKVKAAKEGCAVGKTVTYTIQRDGAQQTLTATLAPVPQDVLEKWAAMDEKDENGKVARKDS